MSFKKRVNGSWTDTSYYIHKTSTDTITTLPADLYADGNNATVGLVGNMSQTGSPTPQNPIQPSECGERTGNLWDGISYNAYVTSTGEYVSPDNTTLLIIFKCEPNTTYTIKRLSSHNPSSKLRIAVFAQLPTNGSIGTVIVNDDSLDQSTIITLTDSKYVVVYYKYSTSPPPDTFMVNEGSTALPYEPYGYKIPISSANTTTPVYLGEVQSTRKIKKLVLDGTEEWQNYGQVPNTYRLSISNTQSIGNPAICSHFVNSPISEITSGKFTVGSTWICFRYEDVTDLADFKSYLAAQYAAGTPVTVWYVLAEPETAVVNEPLMKIGDYADSISGITIPVTAGGDTLSVDTTVQPSEVTVNYKGWHSVTDVHEFNNGTWT